MSDHTAPDEATRATEAADAAAEHTAGRPATEEEAARADGIEPDPAAGAAEAAYNAMGAHLDGEGRLP